jgi:DNA-binding response OmpR family regulator
MRTLMNPLIVILDDEPDVSELIRFHLTQAGFEVKGFSDAGSFYTFLADRHPDLVILDLILPDADGLDVCRYLKSSDETAAIRILMLSAKRKESERILGLESGADDYVTKPFSPRELTARVKAILRRHPSGEDGRKVVGGGILSIDPRRYAVAVFGKEIVLTSTEYRILGLLATKEGWVFSRKEILDHLWGMDKIVVDRTVDVHIRHLRKKLGDAGGIIQSVRGVGYRLNALGK